MVGVVTEVNNSRGFAVITSAFPDGQATTSVVFPKFDSQFSGYNGGIQVQNLGTATTNMVAVYSGGGLATDLVDTWPNIQPKASFSVTGPNVVADDGVTKLPANFNGSVVVTSTGGQPIAGIYTSRNDDFTRGDTYTAYNGINK